MEGDEMTKTMMYRDHEKLIYSMAWKFNKSTGIDIDELISEFNLVFCESFKRFDPESGNKFSTYFCGNCRHRLGNMLVALSRQKRKFEILVDNDPDQASYHPEDSVIIYDNLVNSPNPVINSIISIVSIYSLPKYGFKIWLRGLLREFGHPSKDISDTFRILKSLYNPR